MKTNSDVAGYAEEALIHTYSRYPVAFDHGDGVRLFDVEGNSYLDFGAGIAVNALGYNVKYYNNALKSQIDKLIHVSNLYYTEPMAEAAHRLAAASGLKRVFFTNSGTEAVEGAIKTAHKYAWLKDKGTDHEIIAMNGSFHGRSVGSLSVTGNEHYREAFGPLMGKVVFADFNDTADVESKITDRTCAVIMETIQGEGGIHPADPDFMRFVRKICDENDILLILDEIQCGMGRTGKMFAYENYGIMPDIMTTAKGLGCGVPVGAFVVGEKAENVLTAGDHGATYGGNPLSAAAVNAVFDLFKEWNILDNVNETGIYLRNELEKLATVHKCITDVRGTGLMQGMEFSVPAGDIAGRCLKKGLLLITAGPDVIRFVPPLVITKEDIDEMIFMLDGVLSDMGL